MIEPALMNWAAKTGTPAVQNVEWVEGTTEFDPLTAIKELVVPKGATSLATVESDFLNERSYFVKYSNLEKVTIPETITEIPAYCFCFVPNLKEVVIKGNTLVKIGSLAFEECGRLTTINLPNSVREIANSAFSYTNIKKIKLPNGLQSIGSGAFEYGSLRTIEIPESVITIGNYAFGECNSLTKITINKPEGSISGAPWGAPDTCEVIWNG